LHKKTLFRTITQLLF